MALLQLAFEVGAALCGLWLLAVACLVVAVARAGRELDGDLPDFRVPDSFPAIGARGGTAPMDVIGDEVDRMLGGSDQGD